MAFIKNIILIISLLHSRETKCELKEEISEEYQSKETNEANTKTSGEETTTITTISNVNEEENTKIIQEIDITEKTITFNTQTIQKNKRAILKNKTEPTREDFESVEALSSTITTTTDQTGFQNTEGTTISKLLGNTTELINSDSKDKLSLFSSTIYSEAATSRTIDKLSKTTTTNAGNLNTNKPFQKMKNRKRQIEEKEELESTTESTTPPNINYPIEDFTKKSLVNHTNKNTNRSITFTNTSSSKKMFNSQIIEENTTKDNLHITFDGDLFQDMESTTISIINMPSKESYEQKEALKIPVNKLQNPKIDGFKRSSTQLDDFNKSSTFIDRPMKTPAKEEIARKSLKSRKSEKPCTDKIQLLESTASLNTNDKTPTTQKTVISASVNTNDKTPTTQKTVTSASLNTNDKTPTTQKIVPSPLLNVTTTIQQNNNERVFNITPSPVPKKETSILNRKIDLTIGTVVGLLGVVSWGLYILYTVTY